MGALGPGDSPGMKPARGTIGGQTQSPSGMDRPGKFHLATITDVDFVNQTVAVACDNHKEPSDVQVASLLSHPSHAGGVHVFPEVGARCYLFESADNSSFILGFVQDPEQRTQRVEDDNGELLDIDTDSGPNATGLREPLEPGDILLSTRDKNFVVVRRGGMIQISSTPICQRLYIPVQNVIRDYFVRYEGRSPSAAITMGPAVTALADEDEDVLNETPCVVAYSFKSHAQDAQYAVEIRYGSLTDQSLDSRAGDGKHVFGAAKRSAGLGVLPSNNPGALSVTIFSPDADAVRYTFQISREGDVLAIVAGDIHVEAGASLFVKVAQQAKLEVGTSFVEMLAQPGLLRASLKQMIITAISDMTLAAGAINLTAAGGGVALAGGSIGLNPSPQGSVTVGGLDGRPVLIDGGILEKLMRHTHPVVGAAPSGSIPPITKLSPDLVGLRAGNVAKKIKVK